MVRDFINYVLAQNGRKKTVVNLLVIALAPWSLYAFAILMNEIAQLLRGQGIHAQNVGMYFLGFACTGFSIYFLVRYVLTWRKFYLEDRKSRFQGQHALR